MYCKIGLRCAAVVIALSLVFAARLAAQDESPPAPETRVAKLERLRNELTPTDSQRQFAGEDREAAKAKEEPEAPDAPPKRKVIISLKVPDGEPAPGGELLVRCFPKTSRGSYETKTLPLGAAPVEFEAAVPCRLRWETDNLIGYWIKEETIDLAEAPEPLVKEIEALPAGAVVGRIRETDGAPCTLFQYNLVVLAAPPEVQNSYLGFTTGGVAQDAEGRFMVGPLPLGGTYRIDIHGQGELSNTHVASEDFTLTPDACVREIELQLPEGVTVAGRILDPEGNPAPDIQVHLGHRSGNSSREGSPVATDADGEFRFPRVNPELSGMYYLHVKPQQVYRGFQAVLDPKETPTLQLRRGWSLEGLLLEHRTGKVVPGAKLYARPAQYDRNLYAGAHEVQTDAAGRFRFDTLEPLRYRFYAMGVNAVQHAPPWEGDPRFREQVILSGDVHAGANLTPVPPPPEE